MTFWHGKDSGGLTIFDPHTENKQNMEMKHESNYLFDLRKFNIPSKNILTYRLAADRFVCPVFVDELKDSLSKSGKVQISFNYINLIREVIIIIIFFSIIVSECQWSGCFASYWSFPDRTPDVSKYPSIVSIWSSRI